MAYTPTANTMAYFPFVNNQLDQMGNYTLSSSGTQQTIGYKFTANTAFNLSSDCKYAGCWVNCGSASGNVGLHHPRSLFNSLWYASQLNASLNNKICSFSPSPTITSEGFNLNEWHFLAYSYYDGKFLLCKDGITTEWRTGTQQSGGVEYVLFEPSQGSGNGTFSDLIIESEGWSAQDMLNYYNDTCATYGLSPIPTPSQSKIYVGSTNIGDGKIWYGDGGSTSTDSYTISDIPNDNSNKYISIAKSGSVVKSVVFEITSVGTSNTPNDCFFRISSTNSSVNRYGGGIQYIDGSGNVYNMFEVVGRLNNQTDTRFRYNNLINGLGTNTVRLAFDRNGGSYTVNGTTETWTHSTSEKDMVETIMNSSTINAYASRQGGATITVNISVTYETPVTAINPTAVYLGSTKVRPDGESPWTPGSNTLLYMPLDSDLRDLSSYNRTASITNGTISYDTIGGVNCAYPSSNGRINIPMTDFNNLAYTESIWLYATGGTYWKFVWGNKNSSGSYIDVTFVTNDSNGNKWANYFGGDHFSNKVYTTGAWKLITVTRSGNTVKMYEDGVRFYTYSYSNPYAFASIDLFSRSDYGQQRPGYAADFVVEKVCWTDQEILDYYNQTKSKYIQSTLEYDFTQSDQGWTASSGISRSSSGFYITGATVTGGLIVSPSEVYQGTPTNIKIELNRNGGSTGTGIWNNGVNSNYWYFLPRNNTTSRLDWSYNGTVTQNSISLGTGDIIWEMDIDSSTTNWTVTHKITGNNDIIDTGGVLKAIWENQLFGIRLIYWDNTSGIGPYIKKVTITY